MCGIVGYVGHRNASSVLLDGLKRLEYRGYDSSGLAIVQGGGIQLRRSVGKISNLEGALRRKPLEGSIGLGHTRWATHGAPSEQNAHPHTDCSRKVVVVHNGIIENFDRLKAELARKGHAFRSQTDTEVIAHLIEERGKRRPRRAEDGGAAEKAFFEDVRASLLELEGAYALGIVSAEFPGLLIAARKDCPLVLGLGEKENFIASDIPAILPYTRRMVFLENEEIAVVREGGAECFTFQGKRVEKRAVNVDWDPVQAEKSGFSHFMLKEIMEQPTTVQDTMRGRIVSGQQGLDLGLDLPDAFLRALDKVTLVACGTSYHAALVGRFWFESLAKLPCQVEIASEFRYRPLFLGARDLSVFISQSGETADTLAALRLAKAARCKTLAVCNVLGSSITTAADDTLYTHCGPEIGVASTKAFTGQLTVLLLLALHCARARGALSRKQFRENVAALLHLPRWVREALKADGKVEAIARKLHKRENFLYLGRNLNYPLALEGALKLKEISYIHAEGYPAGEMKHGPIALIEENLPVVAIATRSSVYEKTCSNIQEARARGGYVVAVASDGDAKIAEIANEVIAVPAVPESLSPIVNAVPLQLLAYHIAALRGCDVDQPRNLAKSVTVE